MSEQEWTNVEETKAFLISECGRPEKFAAKAAIALEGMEVDRPKTTAAPATASSPDVQAYVKPDLRVGISVTQAWIIFSRFEYYSQYEQSVQTDMPRIGHSKFAEIKKTISVRCCLYNQAITDFGICMECRS